MKKLLIILVIFAGLGYGGYKLAVAYASDYMVEKVADEMITEEEKEQLLSDPELVKLLEDDITDDDLPFTTKEEALKVVTKKFSMSEINELREKASSGLNSETLAEIKGAIEGKLSEEEIKALKVIALKEIQSKQ